MERIKYKDLPLFHKKFNVKMYRIVALFLLTLFPLIFIIACLLNYLFYIGTEIKRAYNNFIFYDRYKVKGIIKSFKQIMIINLSILINGVEKE